MTSEEIAIGEELERIFMPLAHRKREGVRRQGGRFVHYTSADNAVKILTSRRFWMRNARCMNDYMEAYFGHQKLVRLFQNQELKTAFIEALAPYGEDVGNRVLKHFDEWWKNIQFNTYITSISEHDQSEDVYGRLSMWRAYGGGLSIPELIDRVIIGPSVYPQPISEAFFSILWDAGIHEAAEKSRVAVSDIPLRT